VTATGTEWADRVHDRLWPGRGPRHLVYAVLDGARDPRLVERLEELRFERQCLFLGPLADAVLAKSPWLVRLVQDARPTRWLLEAMGGKSWGVFLRSPGDLMAVRRHLRTLLRVRDEDDRKLLFRFYDPRVLRAFLPTIRPGEVARFVGPVFELLLETEEGTGLDVWSLEDRRLERESWSFAPPAPVVDVSAPRVPVEY
jgi:hypothetical protein